MIVFENETIVPGPLEEVRERILVGQSLPSQGDFVINLLEKRDASHYLLYIVEKILVHELGYHLESTETSPTQVVWSQIDHKRFIDRTLKWTLEPVEGGTKVHYNFQARVIGSEMGEILTRPLLTEISKQHLDRLLDDFKEQMRWVEKESKKSPSDVA